jgi:hypothetical protein
LPPERLLLVYSSTPTLKEKTRSVARLGASASAGSRKGDDIETNPTLDHRQSGERGQARKLELTRGLCRIPL